MANIEYIKSADGAYSIKITATLAQERMLVEKLDESCEENNVHSTYDKFHDKVRNNSESHLLIKPITNENYQQVLKAYQVIDKYQASEYFKTLPNTFAEFVNNNFPNNKSSVQKQKQNTLQSFMNTFKSILTPERNNHNADESNKENNNNKFNPK